MLSEETWLTAEEAFELGLITTIAGELKQAASVNIDSFNNAPNELLDILNLEPEVVDATISITADEAFEEVVEDNDNFARLEAAHQRLAIITKLASL